MGEASGAKACRKTYAQTEILDPSDSVIFTINALYAIRPESVKMTIAFIP